MDGKEWQKKTEEAGIEYGKGLERFMGKKTLYHRFLGKFLEDASYRDFCVAYAAGDLNTSEKTVHTLKGTSGNLSLMRLYRASDAMVQAIRSKKPADELDALAKNVRETYAETCEAIRAILA